MDSQHDSETVENIDRFISMSRTSSIKESDVEQRSLVLDLDNDSTSSCMSSSGDADKSWREGKTSAYRTMQYLSTVILSCALVAGIGYGIFVFANSKENKESPETAEVTKPINTDPPALQSVTAFELGEHDTKGDCWVAFYTTIYDLTEYADTHPGGAAIVTNLAGTDGTDSYELFHDACLLDTIDEFRIGTLIIENKTMSPMPSTSEPSIQSLQPSWVSSPSSLPSSRPSETPTQNPSIESSSEPSCEQRVTNDPASRPTLPLFPNASACGEDRDYCTTDSNCCEPLRCFHFEGLHNGLCFSANQICDGIGSVCAHDSDCCGSLRCIYFFDATQSGLCTTEASFRPSSAPSTHPISKPVAEPQITTAPLSMTPTFDNPTVSTVVTSSPLATNMPASTASSPTAKSNQPVSSLQPTAGGITPAVSSSPTSTPQMTSAPTDASSSPTPYTTIFPPSMAPTSGEMRPPTESPTTPQITSAPTEASRPPTRDPTTPPPTMSPTPGTTPLPTESPTLKATSSPTNEPSETRCAVTRISMEEVEEHNQPDDCWVVLHDQVFDLTEYAPTHPGNSEIITNSAGTDASEFYGMFHTEALLVLVDTALLGVLEGSDKDPC